MHVINLRIASSMGKLCLSLEAITGYVMEQRLAPAVENASEQSTHREYDERKKCK